METALSSFRLNCELTREKKEMENSRLISIITSMIVGVFLNVLLSEADSNPPNIIFMFADDLGYADLACYGHPYAETPNLDRLASEGTRFSQCYVTGVTCNPSRTGLMTGIYPARFQKYTADFGFGNRATITDLLKTKGYRTGHFGKWHIGPTSMAISGRYGMDEVKVIGGNQGDPEGRDARIYTEALDFIESNAKQGRPFYVNIWGHSTHFPVHVHDQLTRPFNHLKVKRSDFSITMQHKFDECQKIGGNLNESMRQYLADVYALDRNVGRVVKKIDDLGIRDNSLVVFSSDHGPAPVIPGKKGPRKYSKNMLGYAGILKGGKHQQYEGGVRVPFILRWPGKVPSAKINESSVISLIDWFPTLCKIAGVTDLRDVFDGEDVSDIWFGSNRDRGKPLFWKTSSAKSTPAMRLNNWKFHMPLKRNSQPELYDLSIDPAESQNLAASHPTIIDSMRSIMKTWLSELPQK